MRISKLWSAICAAAVLTGFLSVRAQDNPAQAAARAALMEKLSAPNAQPNPPANKPTAITTPPSVVTPTAPAPTRSATPPAPASAGDTPAQAAARAALMGKMSDLNAQPTPPANPNLAPIVITPSTAAANQPGQPANVTPVSPPSVVTQTAPAPASAGDTPAQTAARAALIKKVSELNAQQNRPANSTAQPPAVQATTPAPEVVMTPVNRPDTKAEKAAAKAKAKQEAEQAAADLKAKKEADKKAAAQKAADQAAAKRKPAAKQTAAPPANATAATPAKPAAPAAAPAVKPLPANASYAGKSLGFKPVEAPLPPVSTQKQAALQALLARYMANQISPDEYQKERAAILAGP